MRTGRLLIILVAIGAVAIAAIVSMGGSDEGGGGSGSGAAATTAADDAVRVPFAYSPEKEQLLEPLVRAFNEQGAEVGGRPVFVEAQVVSSGEAQDQIGKQQLRPVVWSPASSLWGRLLNFQADQEWAPDDNPSIVRTPLVIAMWEPLAKTLGWPEKQVGFDRILELATSERGWAAFGRPEYGKFKLGHTNPDFSTSGLSAVAAEYYAATGKREGLTVEDVEKPSVRKQIRDIERSIVHYGDTTLFFAEQMKRYGPAYASAVAMEEVTLLDFNRDRGGQPKLVALYPREGTFDSDNPFIVLDAPWVTAEQKQGAAAFQAFLEERITPEVAAKAGFRPGDPDAKPIPPITTANGVDPEQPARTLSLPEPRVLARIKSAWREDRKPANIQLVFDTSGSMGEEGKLEEAKRGLRTFFSQLSPRDRIGLIAFNDRVFPLVDLATFGRNQAEMRSTVDGLLPEGQTAAYDAIGDGVGKIIALDDDTRINAVVALTDGEDNQSSSTVDQLVAALERQTGQEGEAVRVYTIAYGRQANKAALERIAQASGGKAFTGDPKQIEAVYRSISSFF
ncbi:MAG: VWA domain-containing protein [Solirubrobacteraceae bacterium]|nr:VWA domain-containing protein [Solirubrobacteraceae bacterium]